MYLEYGLGDEDIRNPAEFPDDPVLIGFEITDQDVVTNFGIEAKWKSRQTTLMVGQLGSSVYTGQTCSPGIKCAAPMIRPSGRV